MLTISEIAKLYMISNRQVHDLINYGYLNVADVHRENNKGITYLFSESELEQLDIPSLLAHIRDMKQNKKGVPPQQTPDFKKVIKIINHYDRFFDEIKYHPEEKLLQICFYLFHLNHYAKKRQEESSDLYALKSKVIKKIYQKNPARIELRYLIGPDRYRVWLCSDCKNSARQAGISYTNYIKNGNYCPKCDIQTVQKEYYSLVEFRLDFDDYRFTFHLPRSSARWIPDLSSLPEGVRRTGTYNDRMYLYGRPIGKIEERLFPLEVIKEKLNEYLQEQN